MYEDKFKEIACGESDHITPTLILLGIRLGIDRVTPVYWRSLEAMLKHPQSVGIAGYEALAISFQLSLSDPCAAADACTQWSTVGVPLFCGSSELAFLLSRPSPYPSCTTVPRTWVPLHKRRARFLPYASAQEATHSGHGSKHVDWVPYQGRRRLG